MGKKTSFVAGATLSAMISGAGIFGLSSAEAAGPLMTATGAAVFTVASEPGDYIGQGRQATYSARSYSTVEIKTNSEKVTATVHNGPNQIFAIEFAAGKGDSIHTGLYGNAERAAFKTGRSPGLDISSSGRGCNQIFGDFRVDDVSMLADGSVNKLDVSFTQRCESSTAPALVAVSDSTPRRPRLCSQVIRELM